MGVDLWEGPKWDLGQWEGLKGDLGLWEGIWEGTEEGLGHLSRTTQLEDSRGIRWGLVREVHFWEITQ